MLMGGKYTRDFLLLVLLALIKGKVDIYSLFRTLQL
jgi:hypothetical protein